MDWNYFVENFQFVSPFWAFGLPLALEVIDFLTGYVNACIKKERDSSKMREGGGKKFAEAMCLLVAQLFTWAMGLQPAFLFLVSLYIVWMETVSIVENVKKLGMPIPTDVEHKIDEGNKELFGDTLDIEHSADDDRDLSPKE
jgi:toxin secretion/phage lysis holin